MKHVEIMKDDPLNLEASGMEVDNVLCILALSKERVVGNTWDVSMTPSTMENHSSDILEVFV